MESDQLNIAGLTDNRQDIINGRKTITEVLEFIGGGWCNSVEVRHLNYLITTIYNSDSFNKLYHVLDEIYSM